jgi:hypothetical protein
MGSSSHNKVDISQGVIKSDKWKAIQVHTMLELFQCKHSSNLSKSILLSVSRFSFSSEELIESF